MWSYTAPFPKFFFVDARAILPLSVFMLHWSYETFYFALIGVVFFAVVLYFGYSPSSFVSMVIVKLYGGNRQLSDVMVTRRRCRW